MGFLITSENAKILKDMYNMKSSRIILNLAVFGTPYSTFPGSEKHRSIPAIAN